LFVTRRDQRHQHQDRPTSYRIYNQKASAGFILPYRFGAAASGCDCGLARQLKRYFADVVVIPEEVRGFIAAVNAACWQSDDDRNILF